MAIIINGSTGINVATGNVYVATTPFYENGKTIASNYTVGGDRNAMSIGPITLADGVVLTITDGGSWTVV